LIASHLHLISFWGSSEASLIRVLVCSTTWWSLKYCSREPRYLQSFLVFFKVNLQEDADMELWTFPPNSWTGSKFAYRPLWSKIMPSLYTELHVGECNHKVVDLWTYSQFFGPFLSKMCPWAVQHYPFLECSGGHTVGSCKWVWRCLLSLLQWLCWHQGRVWCHAFVIVSFWYSQSCP
jgi:hypothetical protein